MHGVQPLGTSGKLYSATHLDGLVGGLRGDSGGHEAFVEVALGAVGIVAARGKDDRAFLPLRR